MSAPVIDILRGEERDLAARAAGCLADGGVVVLPTETVYGAAARLDRPAAVRQLRQLRERLGAATREGSNASHATPRPFTPHVADRQAAGAYLDDRLPELVARATRKLWPGPVALVIDVSPARRSAVASGYGVNERDVYAADGSVTLRCPDDTLTRSVLASAGGPIVMTMAAGADPDLAAFAVTAGHDVDLILDAGPTRFHKPSTIVRVSGDSADVVRAGVYDERIVRRQLGTTVLFVCSGNTCRSPMAEAIARQVLAERLNVSPEALAAKGVTVTSAGTGAMPGGRATPQAIEALAQLGLEGALARHRSRPITVEAIHAADAVFVMGRTHGLQVVSLVPSAADKVLPLDPDQDIDDPIGGDVTLYRELAGKMRGLIADRLAETVLK